MGHRTLESGNISDLKRGCNISELAAVLWSLAPDPNSNLCKILKKKIQNKKKNNLTILHKKYDCTLILRIVVIKNTVLFRHSSNYLNVPTSERSYF